MPAQTFQTPVVSQDLDAAYVARYVLALDARRDAPDVTECTLHQILYVLQGNYLAATGRRLFANGLFACPDGPVVEAIGHVLEGRTPARGTCAEASPNGLPSDAREFIDAVWDLHKDRTAGELEDVACGLGTPWDVARTTDGTCPEIPTEEIKAYFREQVPADQRAHHPDVVVVDQETLDELDEQAEEIVAQAVRALR